MGRTFILERRRNHGSGMGYHTHICVRNGGREKRVGYALTRQGDTFYAVPHGAELVDIRKCFNALLEDIKPYAIKELGTIPDSYMLRPSKDSIPLFDINRRPAGNVINVGIERNAEFYTNQEIESSADKYILSPLEARKELLR